MTKKKAKAKPRQWNLKGWVAVPTTDLGALNIVDLESASDAGQCGCTKAILRERMGGYIGPEYATLRLDIVATAR